jgi:hypothetical protein
MNHDEDAIQQQAEAMAEVHVLPPSSSSSTHHHNNDHQQQPDEHHRVAAEAVMGAGEWGFQVQDESGTLVQQRFLEFLSSLYVQTTTVWIFLY